MSAAVWQGGKQLRSLFWQVLFSLSDLLGAGHHPTKLSCIQQRAEFGSWQHPDQQSEVAAAAA
jgi:hypothetical protein